MMDAMKTYCLILILPVLSACTEEKKPQPPPETKATSPSKPPAWPAENARLTPTAVRFPKDFGMHLVFIDAGHGAPGNSGNTSSLCIDEQDHNLRVANHLAGCLTDSGHFLVLASRKPGVQVKYRKRMKAARKFKADAFISIHSDARGAPEDWSPAPGRTCPRNLEHPGFAILWSDQGPDELIGKRLSLARAIASRMAAAGFLAYNGSDYENLYVQDQKVPGVFVDRHQPGQRILLLHGPSMPSVIIETHHAWDVREERRWQETETLDTFCQAVTGALVDLLTPAK